jgi:hypothetical protein
MALVTFFRFIQNQSHVGTASTVTAEKNPQDLIRLDSLLEVVAGLIVNAKHPSPLAWEYMKTSRSYNADLSLFGQARWAAGGQKNLFR